jgi:hypothetical protein
MVARVKLTKVWRFLTAAPKSLKVHDNRYGSRNFMSTSTRLLEVHGGHCRDVEFSWWPLHVKLIEVHKGHFRAISSS